MKKLSLIAIAALISGAAAADTGIYVRSDLAFDRTNYRYGAPIDVIADGSDRADLDAASVVARSTRVNVGLGLNAGGFVVELPKIHNLKDVWVGYALDLGDVVITPKLGYANETARTRADGAEMATLGSINRYGLKLEGEYKLTPNKSVAAYVGGTWDYLAFRDSDNDGVGPVSTSFLAGVGAKVYF